MTDPSPASREAVQDALTYADNIIATLREPFVVLDKSLRVRTANAAFYRDFQFRKKRRRAVSSTTWGTVNGTSRNCEPCCPRS